MSQPGTVDSAGWWRYLVGPVFIFDMEVNLRSIGQDDRLERAKHALIVDSVDVVAHTTILRRRALRGPGASPEFDIEQCPFAVGDVHGNFGAEHAVLENGVDAFAHTPILFLRRHCF